MKQWVNIITKPSELIGDNNAYTIKNKTICIFELFIIKKDAKNIKKQK